MCRANATSLQTLSYLYILLCNVRANVAVVVAVEAHIAFNHTVIGIDYVFLSLLLYVAPQCASWYTQSL